MQNNKKFLYEVDPLFFYDSNEDGFGDFLGFLEKINYFYNFAIDGILFPDFFNQEEIILKNNDVSIFDKYGKLDDFKKIVENLNNNNKEIFVEINLNKIMNSMLLKTTRDNIKTQEIYKYIEEESVPYEDDKSWNSPKKINALKKILTFWKTVGIKNFVFTDFEIIFKDSENLNQNILSFLSSVYNIAKEQNESSCVGIRTFFLNNKSIRSIFKKNLNKVCDFLIDSSFSLIATRKNYEFYLMNKFKVKSVFKKIKQIEKIKNFNYFVSFNNNRIGRISSRWFNENNLINESTKSLLLLQNFLYSSTINFYGDELGIQRLDIKNKFDFQDSKYDEKKRELESIKITSNYFFESQKFISRINSQNVFPWNDENNFGFSKQKNIFRKPSIKSFEFNVKNEIKKDDSAFNFYKNLIEIWKKENLSLEKYKTKFKKNMIILKFEKMQVIINISNKNKNFKINKKWSVFLSSYSNKKYENEILFLCPYESILIKKNN